MLTLDGPTLEWLITSFRLTLEHVDQHYGGQSEAFRLGVKHSYSQIIEFLESQLDANKTPQR